MVWLIIPIFRAESASVHIYPCIVIRSQFRITDVIFSNCTFSLARTKRKAAWRTSKSFIRRNLASFTDSISSSGHDDVISKFNVVELVNPRNLSLVRFFREWLPLPRQLWRPQLHHAKGSHPSFLARMLHRAPRLCTFWYDSCRWLTCGQMDLCLLGDLRSPLQGQRLQMTTGWRVWRGLSWHLVAPGVVLSKIRTLYLWMLSF